MRRANGRRYESRLPASLPSTWLRGYCRGEPWGAACQRCRRLHELSRLVQNMLAGLDLLNLGTLRNMSGGTKVSEDNVLASLHGALAALRFASAFLRDVRTFGQPLKGSLSARELEEAQDGLAVLVALLRGQGEREHEQKHETAV